MNRRALNITAAAAVALLALSFAPRALAQSDDATYENAARLFKQGQQVQALDETERFLKDNPKDARGRFLKGLILTEQGKKPEAIAVFQALSEDYPELPEPYNNLAVLYASQGQYDKARAALEMAIRTHPSYATAHENLGDIYAKMASQAYDKALQIDKGNTAAQTKLELIKELFSSAPRGPGQTLSKAEVRPAQPATPLTVATAPTPAPPKTAPPPPRAPDVSDEVVKTVGKWARAWSQNDVEGYLGFYAADFKTPKGESRKSWEESRRARIAKKKIEVGIDAPSVRVSDDNRVIVTFRQDYRSPGLKAVSTKTLVMVKSGGRWLIQQERTGS